LVEFKTMPTQTIGCFWCSCFYFNWVSTNRILSKFWWLS